MELFNYASPEWMTRATCPDTEDFDIFFSFEAAITAQAQAVCATCPVIIECGTHAIENRIPFGIWGGLTPEQRAIVRRTPARRAYFMDRLDNPAPTGTLTPRTRRVHKPCNPSGPPKQPRTPYKERLATFGVEPATVRTWALNQGLDVPPRGTIAHIILDAYEHAHQPAAA